MHSKNPFANKPVPQHYLATFVWMSNGMAAKTIRGRAAGDPEEDLARWLGTRQKHHSEYVKLLNERKNELLALQIDHGPRSDI